MNRTSLFCATAICVALVSPDARSQSYTTTPSPLYATHEGGAAGYMFGNWATARYEFADGNHTAKAFLIKETAYRHDYRSNWNGVANGRSWSNVQLKMATCDFAKVDKVYHNNPSGPQTLVFNRGVTWPTQAVAPPSGPQPWAMTFPFATAWSKPANTDILLDYVFSGGTLTNNRSWGTLNIGYWLDSFTARQFSCSSGVDYGLSSTRGGCSDSGATTTRGASTTLRMCVYPPSYSNPVYANMISLRGGGSGFGIDTTVVTVLGFRPLPTGIAFPGVTCNRLHVDMGIPHFLSSQKTSTYSGNLQPIYFGLPLGLTPYNALYAGADVIAQSAWTDTQDGSLKISSAAARYIPLSPIYANQPAVRLKSIWSTTIVVYSGVFGDGYNVTTPIWRYKH